MPCQTCEGSIGIAIPGPRVVAQGENGIYRLDEEMVELSLLLPAGEVGALETAAYCRGVSPGQMIRRLIRDFLTGAMRAGTN